MNETDWLTASHPSSMLTFLQGHLGDRKLRLFACGCCRLVWDHLPLGSRFAVGIAERFADDDATAADLARAADVAASEANDLERLAAWHVTLPNTWDAALHAYWAVAGIRASRDWPSRHANDPAATRQELARAAAVLRDVVGTPFPPRPPRPAGWLRVATSVIRAVAGGPLNPPAAAVRPPVFRTAFAAEWRTADAVGLARGMYESRDFAGMPVLADALQEAGCEDDEILQHCRGPGPHVRGCWVVDLVLGKG